MATTEFAGKSLEIRIEQDSFPLEDVLSLAASVRSRIEGLVATAEDIAARDLLDIYNDAWKDYDEVQDDGSVESVENSRLSADEFKSKMALSSVSVGGDSCVDLWFDDNGLFWGHSICVSSLEGVDFSSADAQFCG